MDVPRDGRSGEIEAQIAADLEMLEQRLAQENPGVQAVMDAYGVAQPALNRFDSYTQVVSIQPSTHTSNGSA